MAINGLGFFSYNKGAIKYSIDDTQLPIINIEITNPKSFNSNFDISKRDTKNIILEIFEKQTDIAEFDEDLKKDFFKGFNKILTSYSSEYKSNKSKYKKAKSEIVKIQPVMNLPKNVVSLKANKNICNECDGSGRWKENEWDKEINCPKCNKNGKMNTKIKDNKSRKIKTLIKAKDKVYKQSKFKKPNYDKYADELRTAMPPGYRVSKTTGKVYFENRINRTDKKGSLTGLSTTQIADLSLSILRLQEYQEFLNFNLQELKNKKLDKFHKKQMLYENSVYKKYIKNYKVHINNLKKLL